MAKFTLSFKTENCKGCELYLAGHIPKGLLELEKEETNDAEYYPAGITRSGGMHWLSELCKNVSGLCYHNHKE